MKTQKTLIGPFTQILTMTGLKKTGPLVDQNLALNPNSGILCDGDKIIEIGNFDNLYKKSNVKIYDATKPSVALPGFVDAHTHICFAGSRARDYALRVSGKSYLDIAQEGGGILDTVEKTRAATETELTQNLLEKCNQLLKNGVTTCEVKSGYGLTIQDEIKMLRAIQTANQKNPVDLIPTCLAAHTLPREFSDHEEYLQKLIEELLPQIKKENLSNRIDIFIEEGAFSEKVALPYLQKAKEMGFTITVHADQFSTGGCAVAAQVGAISADHLEVSSEVEFQLLKKAGVIATVLPGSSIGLGSPFAPARKILDHDLTLAIASDWNPGSAPMGDLLLQASVLGAAEKLTIVETLAGITTRAAMALNLHDRGTLQPGQLADFSVFETDDYREIFYHQGQMKPSQVWKKGKKL